MTFVNRTQKTYVLAAATRREILSLFGTAANVAAKLKLTLSYHTVNQALRGLLVRPEDGQAIVSAWRDWKAHYVRGEALGLRPHVEHFERVPEEETDALADREIEAWTRRLRPPGPKTRVDL